MVLISIQRLTNVISARSWWRTTAKIPTLLLEDEGDDGQASGAGESNTKTIGIVLVSISFHARLSWKFTLANIRLSWFAPDNDIRRAANDSAVCHMRLALNTYSKDDIRRGVRAALTELTGKAPCNDAVARVMMGYGVLAICKPHALWNPIWIAYITTNILFPLEIPTDLASPLNQQPW